MIRRTEFREIRKATNDMLNYLESHPYASVSEVVHATGYDRQQVLSMYYQYGFTGSLKAKSKFPRLWKIGEKIRAGWKRQDLVDQAKAAEAADKEAKKKTWTPKLKKGPLPFPEQAKEVTEFVTQLEKRDSQPTRGQQIVREVLDKDGDELARLRNEVTSLRFLVAFLSKELGLKNANAI